ncbi:hypothetical protein FHL06_03975 [Lactobacillus halodurans]|uniref:Uncharacterized protein n=1 Tax=Companilactobacillus halodurans TaxID=2584183 RepID=A0A5P0ZN64_9LACO|nr:hypothetical protein [Companilactobacillus halodurans]MQS75549.1 hypothetical protein [Companilactobacillus halodurans]
MSKIEVNLSEKSFLLEGSDEFIESYIKKLVKLISNEESDLDDIPDHKGSQMDSDSPSKIGSFDNVDTFSNNVIKSKINYEKILREKKAIVTYPSQKPFEKVSFNFEIPGKSIPDKTRNLAILLAHFIPKVSKDVVREAAKEKKIYNDKNFSAYINTRNSFYTVDNDMIYGQKIKNNSSGEIKCIQLFKDVYEDIINKNPASKD